jgi:transposase-like protein
MKPNYSELSKIYRISRQTISKYDKGFKKKGQRAKGSILDKYADEIKEKINLPGATITGVLTDLQNRGVEDILITSVDGLKGFPEAINSIFPKTEVQLCIIHQIRNSLKYVASKDKKAFMRDLKLIYRAANKDIVERALDDLEDKWGKKYSIVTTSWRNNWDNLTNYFKYPAEIRKIMYTTNIIESVHRQFRKLTKTKGAFPNEDSLLKLLYMGIQNAKKKWTQPIPNWGLILSQLSIFFEGRLEKALKL